MWNWILTRCVLALCALSVIVTASPLEQRSPRIVGGTVASLRDAPYIAAILQNLDFYLAFHCGGSIISSRHILSAAHCFADTFKIEFEARVGSKFYDHGGIVITVKNINIHPRYNQYNNNQDIAVLELTEHIPLNDEYGIHVANLPSLGIDEGQDMMVAGWGATEETGGSHCLRKVNVPIVKWKICQKRYAYANIKITSNMICAGCMDLGGIDACKGDSGGPIEKNGTVYGIVSFGMGCGSSTYPGVYTNVAKYVPWIKSYIEV